MRRVLLVSPSAVAGGAERALFGLARHLPTFEWQPHVVLLEHGPLEKWLADIGVSTEALPTGRTREVHRTALTVACLARAARRRRASALISNQAKGHVFGGLAGMVARRPALFWQQGIPEHSLFDRAASRIPATAIVASCEDAVRAQRRLTPHARLELIHLGVDVAEIANRRGSGPSVRRRLALGQHRTVGIVGRLQPWKGQDLFLRAASLVARHHSDVHFLVVGGAVLGWEGSYPADLERLVARTPELVGRVHFVGHQADVYPWYDALDVVVHASHGEPFGLVLVEAMALGRPVVATATGGPTEILEDGRSGLLVPPGDEHTMAEAILRILADRQLADRLSRGATDRVHRFSATTMAARWAHLLDTVTADGLRDARSTELRNCPRHSPSRPPSASR